MFGLYNILCTTVNPWFDDSSIRDYSFITAQINEDEINNKRNNKDDDDDDESRYCLHKEASSNFVLFYITAKRSFLELCTGLNL